ncbi:MAG: hypothetical protein FJ276_20460, partial [Planctomycetes bacterium]|nr:hypothetical protein [Planctomycetota bacterium]
MNMMICRFAALVATLVACTPATRGGPVVHCLLPLLSGQLLAPGATGVPPTPMKISGVYPHLCTYADYRSPDGAFTSPADSECGIGAIVPWAGKLWMVN